MIIIIINPMDNYIAYFNISTYWLCAVGHIKFHAKMVINFVDFVTLACFLTLTFHKVIVAMHLRTF